MRVCILMYPCKGACISLHSMFNGPTDPYKHRKGPLKGLYSPFKGIHISYICIYTYVCI